MSRSRYTLSRPRTKLYDANYSIGESYYKSALDGIDRKYGRSLSSEPIVSGLRASLDRERERPTESTSPRPVARDTEGDEFFDDIGKRKTQVATLMGEFDSIFENRVKNGLANEKARSGAAKAFEDESEEDLSTSMERLRAARESARAATEEIDELESSFGSGRDRSMRSKLDFSDKLMESVGLSGKARTAVDEESSTMTSKKRILKITATSTGASESSEGDNLTRWTALKSGSERRRQMLDEGEAGLVESAAAARARKSRARLDDLEAEMQAITERGAAREKRARDLKALVEENEANAIENLHSTLRIKNTLQSEKKMVSL